MERLRVLLVDDHDLVRFGISNILDMSDKIEVVAEASSGNQALSLYHEYQPDLVVLDLSMPGMDGIDTTSRLINSDKYVNILILTMHESPEYAWQVFEAGAKGYVLKNSSKDELYQAVEQVACGKIYLQESLKEAMDQLDTSHLTRESEIKLSMRHAQILELLALGMTSQEIGDKLILSRRTIESHRDILMKKFNVHSTTALVKVATDLGYIH